MCSCRVDHCTVAWSGAYSAYSGGHGVRALRWTSPTCLLAYSYMTGWRSTCSPTFRSAPQGPWASSERAGPPRGVRRSIPSSICRSAGSSNTARCPTHSLSPTSVGAPHCLHHDECCPVGVPLLPVGCQVQSTTSCTWADLLALCRPRGACTDVRARLRMTPGAP
jgi:hypothetical protein